MQRIYILLLGGICIFLNGCNPNLKTYQCPGFTSTVLASWFPYGNTNTLIFENGSGLRDTITLKSTVISYPHEEKGIRRSCDAISTFESSANKKSTDQKLYIRLTKFEFEMDSSLLVSLFIKGSGPVEYHGVSANSLATSMRYGDNIYTILKQLPTVTLSGKTFTDVAYTYRDTVLYKGQGIYKIYIAKNQGLVGYEEYPSRNLWVLQ